MTEDDRELLANTIEDELRNHDIDIDSVLVDERGFVEITLHAFEAGKLIGTLIRAKALS